jgi:hypothetical protein
MRRGQARRYGRLVTSNLDCVGLAVPHREAMRRLIGSALDTAELIGRRDERCLYRWQDLSGARLLVSTEGSTIVDFLPSYAAEPGARLANVRAVNEDVAVADVLDDSGELVTRLAAGFEQRSMFPATPVDGPAAIVALGVDATVHASADAFAVSDASPFGGNEDPGESPTHFVEHSWSWPPRMAAESVISYGMFNTGESAQAYARLNGRPASGTHGTDPDVAAGLCRSPRGPPTSWARRPAPEGRATYCGVPTAAARRWNSSDAPLNRKSTVWVSAIAIRSR